MHDTRARACISLIEFDVIKVSHRRAASLHPHVSPPPPRRSFPPSASPRNNYGLRCSVAFVSALHLYPLVLTCTNILVRIAEERKRASRVREGPVRGRRGRRGEAKGGRQSRFTRRGSRNDGSKIIREPLKEAKSELP